MTKIRFFGGQVEKLNWSPLEESKSKFKLYLRAPLTARLADALQCRGLCYSEPDGNASLPVKEQVQPSARQWKGSISIPVEISGGDIVLGDRNFRFELIHNIKVDRDESDESLALFVGMICHLDGKEVLLYKFCQEQLKTHFTFTVAPAQGALKFTDETEDDEEGETDGAPTGPAIASQAEMSRAAKGQRAQ